MSLLLFSAVGLAGMVLGRAASRYFSKRKADAAKTDEEASTEVSSDTSASKTEKKKAKKVGKNAVPSASSERPKQLDAFSCQISDVVMLRSGEEAWLCGAVVFSEEKGNIERPLAALFVGPSDDVFVLARKQGGAEDLFWLKKLHALPPHPGSEPPHVIELDAVRFDRERRLPVYTSRLGTDAPTFSDEVVLAEYHASTEERLFVVTGGTRSQAYRGERLMAGMYDVLPGADRDE